MSEVVIQSPAKVSSTPNVNPTPKVEAPKVQSINSEINAKGRTEVGEKALQKALTELSDIFNAKNISVSTVVDTTKGISSVRLTDSSTGQKIAELPPKAAVSIAEKAKEGQIGWLIDSLA